MKIKVAIDAGTLSSEHAYRGIGVHTRELYNAIHKIDPKDIEIKLLNFVASDFKNFDIIHFQNFQPYVTNVILPVGKQKVIYTIHDVIPLLFPKIYKSGIRGYLKFIKQKKSLQKVDGIITISKTSKKDICRYLAISEDKVRVIYLAPPPFYKKLNNFDALKKIKVKYKLPEKFCLYVGDVNYNKNIINLADACINAGVDLVMVGKALTNKKIDYSHSENQQFKLFLDRYKNNKRISRLGFIPDKDIVSLYNLASLYVAPSLAEGFDLNAQQAQVCGLPLIASDIDVHKEILRDSCIYVNPNDSNNISSKIILLLSNSKLRQEIINKGLNLVKNFTWEKTARETLSYYEDIQKSN